MIQSRPALAGKGMIIKALALLIAAVTAIMFSPMFGKFCAAVQFAGIACAAYSLFIIIKYVLTDYLYTLEDSHLTVHKVTKSQSLCVADIELGDITAISCGKKSDPSSKSVKTYSYIKNPGSADICTVTFNIAGSSYTLLIEPDEMFYRELLQEYEYIKNNNFNDEEDND